MPKTLPTVDVSKYVEEAEAAAALAREFFAPDTPDKGE